MTDHASWCTDHYDDECRTSQVAAGDVMMRLVWFCGLERPQLMVGHYGHYPYPCLLLPVREAADFAGLMQALGHARIAEAITSLMTSAGAVLTEQYGHQRWEIPS